MECNLTHTLSLSFTPLLLPPSLLPLWIGHYDIITWKEHESFFF